MVGVNVSFTESVAHSPVQSTNNEMVYFENADDHRTKKTTSMDH